MNQLKCSVLDLLDTSFLVNDPISHCEGYRVLLWKDEHACSASIGQDQFLLQAKTVFGFGRAGAPAVHRRYTQWLLKWSENYQIYMYLYRSAYRFLKENIPGVWNDTSFRRFQFSFNNILRYLFFMSIKRIFLTFSLCLLIPFQRGGTALSSLIIIMATLLAFGWKP